MPSLAAPALTPSTTNWRPRPPRSRSIWRPTLRPARLRATFLSASRTSEGTQFDDTLTGDAGANWLHGRQGDDVIDGGAGDDLLSGGAGTDPDGGPLYGSDILNGGDGNDTVDYSREGQVAAVSVNLATGVYGGQAAGDSLTSIESITGAIFNDVLIGDAGVNELNGHDGERRPARRRRRRCPERRCRHRHRRLWRLGGAGGGILDGTAAAGGDAEGDTLTGIENLNGSALGDYPGRRCRRPTP